jgi:hypothetical protein
MVIQAFIGIYLASSSNNTISNNIIIGVGLVLGPANTGIDLYHSSNIIFGNNIANNYNAGISLFGNNSTISGKISLVMVSLLIQDLIIIIIVL